MVGQVGRTTPGDNLSRSCHGDDVGTESLGKVLAQEMLVLEVDHDTGIFRKPANVVTASVLLNFDGTDLLNQIAQNRSKLLFFFPSEGVVPGHLASAPEVLLGFLGCGGAFAVVRVFTRLVRLRRRHA